MGIAAQPQAIDGNKITPVIDHPACFSSFPLPAGVLLTLVVGQHSSRGCRPFLLTRENLAG